MNKIIVTQILPVFAVALTALLATACEKSPDSTATTTTVVDPAIAAVFIDAEPAGAVTVSETRKTARPGNTVTVSGKIAGARAPFTDGFATAVLADVSLKTCDLIPGDSCPTPWDACCEPSENIKAARLTIQVLGEDGRPVTQSLKGANGLSELDPVVVTGTVSEGSTEENLILNVSGLFQKKS